MADMALLVMGDFHLHHGAGHPVDRHLLEVAAILTIGMMNLSTEAVEKPLQDELLGRGKFTLVGSLWLTS